MKLNEAIKWAFIVGLLYIVYRMMTGGFSGYQFNMPGMPTKIVSAPGVPLPPAGVPFKVPIWNNQEFEIVNPLSAGKWAPVDSNDSDNVYVKIGPTAAPNGTYILTTADVNGVKPDLKLTGTTWGLSTLNNWNMMNR